MTVKKQSKPSKNPAATKAGKQKKSFSALFNIISQQTTKERLIFFQTNSKQRIIDLLKDSAYKVPEFKKIKMVTEAINKLLLLIII